MSISSHIYVLFLFLFFFFIDCFLGIIAANPNLRNDTEAIQGASNDYGNIVHEIPSSVLYPTSINDIIDLIKSSNNLSTPFRVSAKGNGYSVRGQAMARGGVVVDMSSLRNSKNGTGIIVSSDGFPRYADVWGEQLWIDVLRATLKHGLAPISWTDYLYLSVGGTLSNAGIGGQTFKDGPLINEVLEVDVITGNGEFFTCSRNSHPQLYFAVLGGLGQFGIITRARIEIDDAPIRVKWVRLLYSDFSMFTRDQEILIKNAVDHVEGFLIVNENTTNEWRSSFSSPSHQSDIVSLLKKKRILYSIELAKYYYDDQTARTIDKEFEMLLKGLNYIPGFIFSKEASFFDFINRMGNLENEKGQLTKSHPWMNLFVPQSRISDFNNGVLATIVPTLNETSSQFLFYPINGYKWEIRMSAAYPREDVFYLFALQHSSRPDNYQIYDKFNADILEFCEKAGIEVKQYVPNYESKQDWIKHFGSRWDIFQDKKESFDPKMILSTGQRIFD